MHSSVRAPVHLSTHSSVCAPDVDECRRSPRPCTNGRCENSVGSYHCACAPGYRADAAGTDCQDVDECTQQSCAGGRCENTPGSYRCVCPAGYHGAGRSRSPSAADIDECAQSPRPCAPGRCENTPGGYRCACPRGYQPGPDGTQCVGKRGRGPAHGRWGQRGGSARACVCMHGCQWACTCRCMGMHGLVQTWGPFRPPPPFNPTSLADVDECQRGGVCEGGRCTNTDGSFDCYCPAGFRTDADKALCQDVDECREYGTVLCGAQRCENIPGSYRCVTDCQPGYRASASGDCVGECGAARPLGWERDRDQDRDLKRHGDQDGHGDQDRGG
uniref:EGF-like domain-containing protein n=1 Tax=Apteryx owenii TaxID=8824 RepID=A0A8B9PA41_APTOW